MKLRLKPGELERLTAVYLAQHPGTPLADSALYARRLRLCGQCSALESGPLCRFCGCLVFLYARLAENRCPRPRAPRW